MNSTKYQVHLLNFLILFSLIFTRNLTLIIITPSTYIQFTLDDNLETGLCIIFKLHISISITYFCNICYYLPRNMHTLKVGWCDDCRERRITEATWLKRKEWRRQSRRWRSFQRRTWVLPCSIFKERVFASCPFLSPPPFPPPPKPLLNGEARPQTLNHSALICGGEPTSNMLLHFSFQIVIEFRAHLFRHWHCHRIFISLITSL